MGFLVKKFKKSMRAFVFYKILTIFGKACYSMHTMSTINISLPLENVRMIDTFIARYGFANRSELFRSLIRLVSHKPALLQDAATFPFSSPQTRSKSTILKEFAQTKKYSKSFLKDLETGLSESSYFSK